MLATVRAHVVFPSALAALVGGGLHRAIRNLCPAPPLEFLAVGSNEHDQIVSMRVIDGVGHLLECPGPLWVETEAVAWR